MQTNEMVDRADKLNNMKISSKISEIDVTYHTIENLQICS